MSRKDGFTLVELLVVISIIAVLVAILLPALNKARNQAKAAICLANLRHWGIAFELYAGQNNGKYMAGWTDDLGGALGRQWMSQLRPFYNDVPEFSLCPRTEIPTENSRGLGHTFGAWANIVGGAPEVKEGDFGSYGINVWSYNPSPVPLFLEPAEWYWRGPDVRGSRNNMPLFFDCAWTNTWPVHTSPPPEWADYAEPASTTDTQMQRICLNRHSGAINMLFLDYSVRRVGLKELWRLKWSRGFEIPNAWSGYDALWPDWMDNITDYDVK